VKREAYMDPKECRQHAENCRRLATEARTVAGRDKFDNLAVTWEQLAVQLEGVKPLLKVMKQIEPTDE
jgi:hypothetical protein